MQHARGGEKDCGHCCGRHVAEKRGRRGTLYSCTVLRKGQQWFAQQGTDAARTIAKGISDPQYAALVARSKDSRMGENWSLMSEMEKDEILAESAKGR